MILTKEHIQEHGGIVHKDGNVFFTNVEKLNACIAQAAPVVAASADIDSALLDRIASAHGESEDPAQFVRNGWPCAGVENVRSALDELMGYVRAAAPAASVAVPAGYALVPLEPTSAMMDAAEACSDDWPRTTWKKAYAAMLAAAPATPAAQAQQPAGDGWIACADRLPECDMKPGSLGVEVLIYPQFERGEHTAFYGCRCTDYPSFYKHGVTLGRVTHWMPLPLPPAPGLMEAE